MQKKSTQITSKRSNAKAAAAASEPQMAAQGVSESNSSR